MKKIISSKKRNSYPFKKGAPFYTMFAVSDYTFAPYKVMWTRVATNIEAAFISSSQFNSDQKVIIPVETATMVAFHERTEAHYFCAMINSVPFRYAVISYSVESTGGFGSPHILKRVGVPKFDRKNKVCIQLAELSELAHEETAKGNDVLAIENKIDELTAEIWGLTREELKEIKVSLEELA